MQIQKLKADLQQKTIENTILKNKLTNFKKNLPPLFRSTIVNYVSDLFKTYHIQNINAMHQVAQAYQKQLNRSRFRYEDEVNFLECEIKRQNNVIHHLKIQIEDIAVLLAENQTHSIHQQSRQEKTTKIGQSSAQETKLSQVQQRNWIRPCLDLLKLSAVVKTGLQTIQEQESSARDTQPKSSQRIVQSLKSIRQVIKESIPTSLDQFYIQDNSQSIHAEDQTDNISQMHTIQKDKTVIEIQNQPDSTKQKNKRSSDKKQEPDFSRKTKVQTGNLFERIALSNFDLAQIKTINTQQNLSEYQFHLKTCESLQSKDPSLDLTKSSVYKFLFSKSNNQYKSNNSSLNQSQQLRYISQMPKDQNQDCLWKKVYIKNKKSKSNTKIKGMAILKEKQIRPLGNNNQSQRNKVNYQFTNKKTEQKAQQQFKVGSRNLQVKYQGQKLGSVRHGKGILIYSNGFCYEGQFNKGVRQGQGVLRFNFIEIYNGQWKNDKMEGFGRIRNCTVIFNQKYKNSLKKDKQIDRLLLTKWTSYKGTFKENSFDGKGILRLQGGQNFEVIFESGKIKSLNNLQTQRILLETMKDQNKENQNIFYPNKTEDNSPESLKVSHQQLQKTLTFSRLQ